LGAMGKSAQVPLHVWLPDAMEGPTPVSALIHAATMVNAGVYLILRLFPLFQSSQLLLELVTVVGAISMIYGGACAITSEDLKRILAYSTISQLGLMFVGIGIGNNFGAAYQLISQGFFKALAFLVAGSVLHATGSRDVEALGGLKSTMKVSFVGFLIAMAAMSGVPPLLGFWSKEWIFSYALNSNFTAAILILVSTVLTTIYGFRALFKVFLGQTKLQKAPSESPQIMIFPIVVLSVASLIGWFYYNYQKILPFRVGQSIDTLTLGVSIIAIITGFGTSYLAFYSRTAVVQIAFQKHSALVSLRKFMLRGMGFDDAYHAFVLRVVMPVARAVSEMESGILGVNSAFFLTLLVAILFLLVLRVI
jgi:NADH-quinone oxidoreductase subunit L